MAEKDAGRRAVSPADPGNPVQEGEHQGDQPEHDGPGCPANQRPLELVV